MAVLRGIYVGVAYTFLMPWMIIFGTVYFVHACYQSKKLFGIYQPINILKAIGEGCGIAFRMMVGYVKTGQVTYVVQHKE